MGMSSVALPKKVAHPEIEVAQYVRALDACRIGGSIMPIDEGTYLQFVSAYKGNDIVGELPDRLVPLWCDDYAATNPLAQLVQVDIAEPTGPPFSYLFDLTPQRN